MPSRKLSMRQLREILRLRLTAQLSMRQIKDSLRLSLGAIQKVISQAEALGLDWATIDQQDDQQLARLFYPTSDSRVSSVFQLPNWVEVHQELKRKGVIPAGIAGIQLPWMASLQLVLHFKNNFTLTSFISR